MYYSNRRYAFLSYDARYWVFKIQEASYGQFFEATPSSQFIFHPLPCSSCNSLCIGACIFSYFALAALPKRHRSYTPHVTDKSSHGFQEKLGTATKRNKLRSSLQYEKKDKNGKIMEIETREAYIKKQSGKMILSSGMWPRAVLVRTDVSEEAITSIIRVEVISHLVSVSLQSASAASYC
jgi:hypothetical protein